MMRHLSVIPGTFGACCHWGRVRSDEPTPPPVLHDVAPPADGPALS